MEISQRKKTLYCISGQVQNYLNEMIIQENITPEETEEILANILIYLACISDDSKGFLYSLALSISGISEFDLSNMREAVKKIQSSSLEEIEKNEP